MASLEEFSSPVKPTLEELNTGKNVTAPVVSRPSNLNLATYAAAMSPDPEGVMNTYRSINAELDTAGKSDMADQLVMQARQKSLSMNTKALTEILASPDFTDEQKQQAAMQVLDETNSQYDVRNLLSVEALSAPVEEESPKAEFHRVEVGAIIDRVNEFKRQEQAILNSELSKEDPSKIKAAADVLGYILPYTESKVAGSILSKMREGDAGAYGEALVLLGNAKMDIREMLLKTPVEDRLALTQAVVQIINDSSTIVMPDGNDFARKDYLQTVLDHGTYDNVDRWVDNVISVLDVSVIGGVVGRIVKGSVKGTAIAEKAGEMYSNVQRRMVKSRVQPTTLSQNYKDTNPDKARAAFETTVADETEEAADALYGTTRNDAIANDMLPEIANPDSSVVAKVDTPEARLELEREVDARIKDFASSDGAIYAFNSEKAQARAAAVARFENVIGMRARKEMFQVKELGEGVAIRAVYGPTDSGFASMQDAVNMAAWSLRESGVTKDQIKLLRRDGSNYVEIPRAEYDALLYDKVVAENISGAKMQVSVKRKPSDILVAVDHQYKFSPADVSKWAEADVKYNIFDRMGLLTGTAGVGSLQRHLVDAHSMLHPNITMGATVAVDRAAGMEKELLELGKTFADNFSKADKEMQAVMQKMIREANDHGKEFSYTEMVAAGLRDSEIQAMKEWRKYWDTIYMLENKDLAKTLKARGYMEFIDEASDTRLFAKPVARNQAGKVGRALDPTTGEVVRLSDAQVKELYEKEGTFAKLKQPMVVNDEAVEFMVTMNAPGKSYLRAITEDTQVLNYRKGYYAVHYKDPYFVVERVKNSRGEVLFERAIATSGSRKDAEALAAAKAATDGRVFNDDFFVRGDVKKLDMSSNDYWDLQQVRGRSAQKVRGKRLEEADTNVVDPAQSNILDPVESMIISARSISHRAPMRDMIETTKARFLAQYEQFLPMGEFGQKVLPNSVGEVMYRGGPEDAKKLADAKTTFEYIKYLEDGYINHIDDTYKAALKGMADIAGNAGLAKTDKALRWMADGRGPSAMGKNLAFNLYLALNPLRQFVVQSHQAVQLAANYPAWIASGKAIPELTVLMAKQFGAKVPDSLLKGAGLTAKQADEMFEQFRKTGQIAAIDKQNLIRGSLLDLADTMNLGRTNAGKAWRIGTAPITWSRRLGFDAGESVNTMTAWLANRDAAIRAGKSLSDSSVAAEVAAKARNYTYNMNAAGDMPYNQNALAAIFQFMQVPHKAMLTMTTNRVLTPAQKSRLLAFNSVMYTLPPAAMISWFGESGFDVLPENQEARDAIIQGFEGYMLNKLLSLTTGEDTTVDWSGLSPMDMYGTMEFITSLFTTDAGTIIASTPSGQLLFGNNPRLTNFAKTTARYFNLVDDYQDPTTFGQVATEFAKLSSGFSNAYKAAYVLEYNKKFGTLGGVTDSKMPTPNAIAQVLGFGSLSDAQSRYVNEKLYSKSQDFEKDVREWYKQTKAHLLGKYEGIGSSEYASKIVSEAWRVWGNDNYKARQFLLTELKRDLQNKDARLYQRILRDHNMMSKGEFESLIKATPFRDEEQKTKALGVLEYMQKYQEEE